MLIIKQLIDALHQHGQTPRLMVDATANGVELPRRVKEQWTDSLPVDLDPSYPLELAYKDHGVACCLSFGGAYDCFFPWEAIYIVQDRDTQLGVVIEEHLPDAWRDRVSASQVSVKPNELSALLEEGNGADESSVTVLKTQRTESVVRLTQPRLHVVPEAPQLPADDDDESPAVTPEDRRAMFRVIDGGN